MSDKKSSWLHRSLAAATLGASMIGAEAAGAPQAPTDGAPPTTDTRKTEAAPKRPRYGADEFDELKSKAPEVLALSLLDLGPAPVKIGSLMGAMKVGEVQAKYSEFPLADVERGKSKGFQEAFDEDYKFDRLTKDTKTPTKVGVFTIEDSPLDVSEKVPFTHMNGVASVALAAGKAITGRDTPVYPLNTQVLGNLGQRVVDIKRTPTSASRIMGTDYGHGILRDKYFNKNTVNVVSISLAGHNPELTDRKSRLELSEQIRKHFGDNTVFVLASGNGGPGKGTEELKFTVLKHNVMRHYDNTIVIGAAQQDRATGADGQPINVYSATDYSTTGADVLMPSSHVNARYASVMPNGDVRHLPFNGTSSATPQAASGVIRPLLERFAASKENPTAVLQANDVLLAIKNTARPIHVAMDTGYSFDVKVDPPVATRHQRKAALITNYPVAGHFASPEHGNGEIDVRAAWDLLEKQEAAVQAGKAKVLARKDATVSLTPTEHPAVGNDAFKALPIGDGAPKSYYSYALKVDDDLYADKITLDINSKALSKKTMLMDPASRPRIFLANPKGEVLEIKPSVGSHAIMTTDAGGAPVVHQIEIPYVVANAVGMQGSATKGQWTVLCTEQLESVDLNFPRAMQPGHVGVTVRRDAKEAQKQLYRSADFTQLPRERLDKMIAPDAPMLQHDLSETGFPGGYIESRLMSAVQNKNESFALALVEARYGNSKNKDMLIKAVKSGDSAKIIDTIVAEGSRLQFFKGIIRSASKEEAISLVKGGFGTLKEEVKGQKGRFNTALHEYVKQLGDKADADVVEEFLKAGASPHMQDAKGRTPLHWARHHLVQGKLMDWKGDLNDPQRTRDGTRAIDIKDDDGKKYSDLPWDLSKEISMVPVDNERIYARPDSFSQWQEKYRLSQEAALHQPKVRC